MSSINTQLPLVYHPNYSFNFDVKHRFVMSKFANLKRYLDTQHLTENIHQPPLGDYRALSLVHCEQYLRDLNLNQLSSQAMRRIGLPWSQPLINRTFTAPLGTHLTAQLALESGIACHLAGGTHHAYHDFGSGFCMVNDLVYTATRLLIERRVRRVLIFDCDVHQGDGTAAMLSNNPYIFTCSIHCENNFPFTKQMSDLDIGLPAGMEDQQYIAIVTSTLEDVLAQFKPDIVLYDAGVDVWQGDSLGKLNISWQGIAHRDRAVLNVCHRHHIAVASVIGGGYDVDHQRLAKRHAIVVEQAARI